MASAKIKQIGDHCVMVDNDVITHSSKLVELTCGFVWFLWVMISMCFLFPTTAVFKGFGYYDYLVLNVILGFLIAIVFTLFFVSIGLIPPSRKELIYRVYTSCDYTGIIIPKVSPEEDQIAICRAVKEVEKELVKIDERNRILKGIAERCK